MSIDYDMWYNKMFPKQPKSQHVSDKRVVTSVNVDPPKDTISLPKKMLITTEEELTHGVPVQVQFEIIPQSCLAWSENPEASTGFYVYHCSIESVRARIKPGTLEFIGAEEKSLDHIIDGTEDSAQEKERVKKNIEKAKEKDEVNRFTGLEI